MRFACFLFLAGFLIGCGGEGEQPDTRECPFCLEEVKVGAFKCKHCGEDPYKGDDKERALEHVLNSWDEKGISTTDDPRDGFFSSGRWASAIVGVITLWCLYRFTFLYTG